MAIPFRPEWNGVIPFRPEWNELSIPAGMDIPIRPEWNATLLIILRNMPPGSPREKHFVENKGAPSKGSNEPIREEKGERDKNGPGLGITPPDGPHLVIQPPDEPSQGIRQEGTLLEIPPPEEKEDNTSKLGAKKKQKNTEDIRTFFNMKKPIINTEKDDNTPTPSGGIIIENTEKESQNQPLDNESCIFRKGRCQKHHIEGEKTILSIKKWGKKSNGLQGWNYSKKVRWICKAGKSSPVAPNIVSSSESIHPDSRAAPGISNLGISDNNCGIPSNTGVGVSRQDESESARKDLNRRLRVYQKSDSGS